MDKEQALEMARCALINIDNMIKIMPSLSMHPLLPIVKAQIEDCIEALDGKEDGEDG